MDLAEVSLSKRISMSVGGEFNVHAFEEGEKVKKKMNLEFVGT